MKKVLFGWLAIISVNVFSQDVTVINRSTLQPIPRVQVFTTDFLFAELTDFKGKVTLTGLSPDDTLVFRHASFQQVAMTVKQIEGKKFKVALSEGHLLTGIDITSTSKSDEKISDASNRIDVVLAKDIAFNQAATSADMLKNTGEVFVQKSQSGGGSPVIRGLEANKVLIVVDGVRLNNAIYRSGHLQNVITLDQSIMERVEVLYGPGSVIYGSDALGGVMHFMTRKPLLAFDDKMNFGGSAYTRYASANFEKTGHLDLNFGFKKVGLLTSATFTDFDDIRSGNSRSPFHGDWGLHPEYVETVNGEDIIRENDNPIILKNTGYYQYNILQKLRFRPNDKYDLGINVHFSNSSDIPRYDRLTEYETITDSVGNESQRLRSAEWYYGPQQWIMASAHLEIDSISKVFDYANITAAFQMVGEDRIDRRFGRTDRRHREETVTVATLNADFTKSFSKRHRLNYGAEVVFNDVVSEAFTENIINGEQAPTSTRYPDGGSQMYSEGGYLKYTLTAPKWVFSLGSRYSFVSLKSQFVDTTFFNFPFSSISLSNSVISNNLSVIWKPGKDWRVQMIFGGGFRSPNVDDVAKVFDSSPGSVIVPNEGLKPEQVVNFELGVSKVIEEKVKVSFTAFYTRLFDFIKRDNFQFNGQDSIIYDGVLSQVQANVNGESAHIYGFSAAIVADFTESLSFKANYNYIFGESVTDTVPLGHIPPEYGQAAVLYQSDKFMAEFNVQFNGWKRIEDYSPSGVDNDENALPEGTPAWYTLNVRTSYQLNKTFNIKLAIENLLDKHYRAFASGISASGVNVIVGVGAKF